MGTDDHEITVTDWTATEIRALRQARRMSVREFAAHLGVSDRAISNWENTTKPVQPRSVSQALLDTSLHHADALVRDRFVRYVAAISGDQQTGDPI